METSTQPEAEQTPATELDQPDEGLMDQLDAIFDGEHKDMPEKAQDPEPGGDAEDPEAVEAAAEMPTIDYDLEIPMPDGRDAMKLGEIKDKLIENERTRSDLDKARAEILQQQQLMSQYMAQVGEIPEGFKEQAQQQIQQYMRNQHEAMLKAIPEWQDKDTFERDRPKLFEAGKNLGYTEQELAQVGDARLVLALKRLADYESREAAARDNVKQIKKTRAPKGQPRKPRTKQSDLDKQVTAAISGNDDDAKYDAIDALLRSN